MHQRILSVTILAVLLSLVVVACGGGDDEEQAAAAASHFTVAPAAPLAGGITRQEGNIIDFTIIVSDGPTIGQSQLHYTTAPASIPSEITFNVGQTVNFTLQPDDPTSGFKHNFTVSSLGISEVIKYGQPTTFTYTFDKPDNFRFFNVIDSRMWGTITVVE